MLRLRLTIERQARTKKIPPHQNTTTVARASWIHWLIVSGTTRSMLTPGSIFPRERNKIGTVRITPNQNFLASDRASESSSASDAAALGSSVIPQIGQSPG